MRKTKREARSPLKFDSISSIHVPFVKLRAYLNPTWDWARKRKGKIPQNEMPPADGK